jgi:hypothetical protein
MTCIDMLTRIRVVGSCVCRIGKASGTWPRFSNSIHDPRATLTQRQPIIDRSCSERQNKNTVPRHVENPMLGRNNAITKVCCICEPQPVLE